MAGDVEAAERFLRESLELCASQGMRAELGKTHICLARLYASSRSESANDKVEEHAREAEQIFERCGMVPYLEMGVRARS